MTDISQLEQNPENSSWFLRGVKTYTNKILKQQVHDNGSSLTAHQVTPMRLRHVSHTHAGKCRSSHLRRSWGNARTCGSTKKPPR